MSTIGEGERKEPSEMLYEGLPSRVIESFPYAIQVYGTDGTSVLVNQALLKEYRVSSRDVVVGKYNVLTDPSVLATGQFHVLKRAFEGETVFGQDIRVPLEDISERYDIHDFDVEAMYQDIAVFPILGYSKRVTYVVALLINRRVYRGEAEIEKAKEYLENHWLDGFDAGETARAANLSKAHFSKLFRKYTGITTYEYYTNCRIRRLKERLLSPNLSVAEAFAACNIPYNGHSARLFRKKVGVSPSAYREHVRSKGSVVRTLEIRVEDGIASLARASRPLPGEQELLRKVFESFPYPIQIFSLDGTARLVNEATLQMIGIKSREVHVGTYNVFRDPIVRDLGAMDKVRQVLQGKTVHLADFRVSYQDMIRHFGVADRDIQTMSSDITCFPLLDANGAVEAFAAVFIIRRIYRGKEEIERGRQYIETHWREPFDANEAAKAACLSRSHFTKLFKKHVGLTPHQYYVDYKVGKLKEKLLDTNLSVAQAFGACNMDYNSHSSRLFRQKVGVTPSTYRNNAKVK